MGHSLQGTSLALASQVERYGLRTMSGSTGGVNVEASRVVLMLSRPATTAMKERILAQALERER